MVIAKIRENSKMTLFKYSVESSRKLFLLFLFVLNQDGSHELEIDVSINVYYLVNQAKIPCDFIEMSSVYCPGFDLKAELEKGSTSPENTLMPKRKRRLGLVSSACCFFQANVYLIPLFRPANSNSFDLFTTILIELQSICAGLR